MFLHILLTTLPDCVLDASSNARRDIHDTLGLGFLLVLVDEKFEIRPAQTGCRYRLLFCCICCMDLYIKCYSQTYLDMFCVVSSVDRFIYGGARAT